MAITVNEWKYIEGAIEDVKSMLLKKREVWTEDSQPFKNFDIAQDFDIDPFQWAMSMCNLKLNRLKTRYKNNPEGFKNDPDARDSLIDLASYATLALALINRDQPVKVDFKDLNTVTIYPHGGTMHGNTA